jgi:hypothetical protein
VYNAPTVSDFKNLFVRDFPYGTDPTIAVIDQDLTNAFNLVDLSINPALWGTQGAYTLGYLYLAAHYLVLNIRASSQGLNGQYNWAQNSKSVGSVSESFTIPQRLIDNPEFMAYYKTNYGAQYMNLVLPLLAGQAFTVCGSTRP